MDKEIYKQFFGQLVRCLVSFFFGMIVARKVIPEEWAGMLLESTIALVTAALIQGVSLLWGWMKICYNVFFARIARCVSPNTSMKEIVRQVKAEHRFITKI